MKTLLTVAASVVATLTAAEMINGPSWAADADINALSRTEVKNGEEAPISSRQGTGKYVLIPSLNPIADKNAATDELVAEVVHDALDAGKGPSLFDGRVVTAYTEKWGVNPITIRNAELVTIHGRDFLRGDGENPGQVVAIDWSRVVVFETREDMEVEAATDKASGDVKKVAPTPRDAR